MPSYAYPTNAEIMRIDPILMAKALETDPILGPKGLFPVEYTDFDMLVWDQRDSYAGLAQWRGLNGDPPRVKRANNKRFKVEPGYYGEFNEVDEEEMTRRANVATFNLPIPIPDLVTDCHDQLMTRQANRMRWIAWTLLTTGTYVVLDKDGVIGTQDSYKIQIYAAPIAWGANPTTARPVFDLRQIPILGRGQSTNFGAGAEAWMTQVTFNNLIGVSNLADIRGERLNFGQTVKSVADVNMVLSANNLPTIVIYEDGYLDDALTFHTFIPDNTIVYLGRRSNGAPLGRFRFTKNVNAPTGKGVYVKTVERGMAEDQPPPAKIEVHRGFNAGPVLWYPGSIFVMQV